MTIYVAMEGGLCQGVSSDDSKLIGASYIVIDYDTEGCDLDNTTKVHQSDGSISEAYIGEGTVDKLEITIGDA